VSADVVWDLKQEEVRIGRGSECDIRINDEIMSRLHAAIQRDASGFVLVDLNSTNGTYVNDKQIQRHRLAAGDHVHLGHHIFRFLALDPVAIQLHKTTFSQSNTDPLTQAYNRQFMQETLHRELLRAKHRHRPLSVAFFDIDQFKTINDTHGRLAGDEILQEFCSRAQDVLEEDAVFARSGGDEFCAILCENDFGEALGVVTRIRGDVASRQFKTREVDVQVTVSVGFVTMDGSAEFTVEGISHLAGGQLHKAKNCGRDCVRGEIIS
jgi:diguanylate cyclase (GGDEF)-like protein